MIQFILGLFGLGDKLAYITSKSDGALAAFKKTLNKLKTIETQIADHHTVQDNIIAEAQKVKQTLSNTADANRKVIAKLEEFLG